MKNYNSSLKEIDRGREFGHDIQNLTKAEYSPSAYSDIPDEDIVALYVEKQDEKAFDELIKRYDNKIFSTALRILKDIHVAEDILQEVYLTLIQKLHTFRRESKFSTWLYRIILNKCYMYLRTDKRRDNVEVLEDFVPYDEQGTLHGRVMMNDWSERPDVVNLAKEAMDVIESAMQELSETHLIVLHLRDIEGFTNGEVSEILGITPQAVKSRIHRARLILRDKITHYFSDR